ncbi:Cna B-type domain-containing protein, partial [Lactobacillus equicursoris]|uniref:Cna B-type domain-containing protein n=1 Tax=Lactobacillus equicursoris TaxID=420645 RepID=UPI00242DCFB9
TSGGAIYVPDEYSQLTVNKHWVNSDGTAAKPGASSVKVDLYRVTKKLNAVKVTVDLVNGWNQTQTYEYMVAKGSTIGLSWESSGAINDGGIASVMVNGIDQKLTPGSKKFTSGALNQDTRIIIKTNHYIHGLDDRDVKVTKTNPQMSIDKDSKTLVDTVNLSSAYNWQKTWSNLHHEDENGNTYYYYVEEESVPGYKTSYRNNNGIKYGQIDVINQEKNEFYHLPQSGGRGLYALLVLGTAIVASGLAFRRKKFN